MNPKKMSERNPCLVGWCLPERTHLVGPFNKPRRTGSRVHSIFEAWTKKSVRRAVEYTLKETNSDISDCRPENLIVVDDLLDDYFRAANKLRRQREAASVGFGSYLGQVLVRNLDGRWHFPSFLQTLKILVSRDRRRGERYWYVLIGGEKVYVFWAAREAIEKTGAVFSLHEFYQRYAHRVSSRPSGISSRE